MCRKCGCPVADMSFHRDNQWKLWSCLVPRRLRQDESNNMSHLKVCNLQGSKFQKMLSVYMFCIDDYLWSRSIFSARICLMRRDHTHVLWLGEWFSVFEASSGTRCPTVASWTCASRISEFSRVSIKMHDPGMWWVWEWRSREDSIPDLDLKRSLFGIEKVCAHFFVSTCRYLKGCFPICYFDFALL